MEADISEDHSKKVLREATYLYFTIKIVFQYTNDIRTRKIHTTCVGPK